MTTSRFPSRGQRNSDMPSAAHRVSLPQRESTRTWLIHGPNLARCQRHGPAHTGNPCSRMRLAKRVKLLSDNTSAKPLRRPVCRRCIASMTCVMSGEFFPFGVDEPLVRDDGDNAVVLGRCRVERDAMGQAGTLLDRPEADQMEQQFADFIVRWTVPPTLAYRRRKLWLCQPAAHFGDDCANRGQRGSAEPVSRRLPVHCRCFDWPAWP